MTAQKGRTHDCKRPLLITKKTLASRGPSTHEAAPCSLSDGRLRFHRGRNMKCWIFLPALAVAGCAANSGVAPLGGDAFVVTRQAATGFSGSGNLKGEALGEAGQYCAGQNKSLMVTNAKETGPPYVMGNFPKAEVEFMCLTPGDPRLLPPSQNRPLR